MNVTRYKNPEISFVDTDAGKIANEMILRYESLSGRKLASADPVRLVILWLADIIIKNRMLIDKAAKMNCPRYAEGEYLDLLCELFDRAERRRESSASTTIRFTLSEVRPSAVIIPSGTRVCSEKDGDSYVFSTLGDTIIPAGKISGEAQAVCTAVGEGGNGFKIGEISELVDVFPYYQSCENITESEGGAEEETDEEFYSQMRSSLEGYSTAGPSGAYEYYAKLSNASIADVKAESETETVETILALYSEAHNSSSSSSGGNISMGGSESGNMTDSNSSGGSGKTDDIKTDAGTADSYAAYCFIGGEQIITNTVSLSSNGIIGSAGVDYTVSYDGFLMKIKIKNGGIFSGCKSVSVKYSRKRAGHVRIAVLLEGGAIPGKELLDDVFASLNSDKIRPMCDKIKVSAPDIVRYDINLRYYLSVQSDIPAQTAVSMVTDAVREYNAWQTAVMGRDINPSKLGEMIMNTGAVKRVDITEPVFTPVGHLEAAQTGEVSLINGGRESE